MTHTRRPGGSVFLLFAVLLLTLACGCGTVASRSQGLRKPYGGVQQDLERTASGDEWMEMSGHGDVHGVPVPVPGGLFWFLDIPFSAVADTLLLPVDAIWRPEPRSESPAGAE